MKLSLGQLLLVYGLTGLVFFVIDLFWLGFAAKGFYERHIGGLLRDQVNWVAAGLFYSLYIGGIQIFVLQPALQSGSGILRTAIMGGLLGLFAYGTFDLTSLALIRKWSVTVTVVDMLWGTILTGATAAATLWLTRTLFKIG
jgi:uncharacterized membrane protein